MDQINFVKDCLEKFEMVWSALSASDFVKADFHKFYFLHC